MQYDLAAMNDLHRLAARTLCLGFDGIEPSPAVLEMVRAGAGGVILFSRNVRDARQVQRLSAALKAAAAGPLLVCIDQEGGRVARLRRGFTALPPMRTLGATGDGALARDVGRLLGRELHAVNIDLDFAPIVDVDTNPSNPVIADRAFSAEPSVVADLGAALITGLQEQGVAACAKHFPGHGDTAHDSHLRLGCVDLTSDRLRSVELPPFEAAVRAGVTSIMTAHVVYPALDRDHPATMSHAAIDGILRKEMGFEGVVVADDLEMKAIADHFSLEDSLIGGLNAGVDLFLICHTPAKQQAAVEIVAKAVGDGRVPRKRLEEAAARVDGMARRFAKPAGDDDPAGVLDSAEHRAVVRRIERAAALDAPIGSVAGSGVDPTEVRR